MDDLLSELKRRNIFKVTFAYLITAWLILQIVAVLGPLLSVPDWLSSVVFVILLVFFPLTLLLAWAYELTPGGIKRTKHVELDDSITHITGRKLDFMVIFLLVLALGFVSYEAYIVEEVAPVATQSTTESEASDIGALAATDEVTSIAVLPFQNLSSDAEQEYFSDGLSEELLNVLAKVDQLRVAARTSSFFFKGKNQDIREIAQKLDVEHVLEGSVRKSGNRVRVTAQLIRAQSGYHLWSETYDYELEDIFKIQDEISDAVVKQLRITLLNEQHNQLHDYGTTNTAAHDAYLLGRYHMRERNPESLAKAKLAFEKAIGIDPAYVLAISGLLDTINLQLSYSGLSREEYETQVATLLAPFQNQEIHSAELSTSIGAVEGNDGNYELALMHYKRAVEINPNYVQALHWGFLIARGLGEKKLAQEYLNRAIILDPYAPIIVRQQIDNALSSGQVLEAEKYARRGIDIAPNMPGNYHDLLNILWGIKGDVGAAWELIQQSELSFNFEWSMDKVAFYQSLGLLQQAEAEIRILEQREPDNFLTHIARLYQEFYKHKVLAQDDITIRSLLDSMANNPQTEVGLVVATGEMLMGNFERCSQIIDQHYPEMVNNVMLAHDDDRLWAALVITTCWHAMGDERGIVMGNIIQQRAELFVGIGLHVTMMEEFPVQLFLAKPNNEEKALKALKRLIEDNNFVESIWSLEFDPMLSSIHEHPEFLRLMAIHYARVAEQKQQLSQLMQSRTEI